MFSIVLLYDESKYLGKANLQAIIVLVIQTTRKIKDFLFK